jgi:multicomponent Na+:H+ antiporter subunit D
MIEQMFEQIIADQAPILMVLLPLTGAFLIPLMGLISSKIRDIIPFLAFLAALGVGLTMIPQIMAGDIIVYELGGIRPPFGITLYVDALSLFVGLVLAGMASFSALYAVSYKNKDPRRGKFYTLFCLQVTGMMGLVLTGDMFNLYVFFEIMSVSTYALVAYNRQWDSAEAAFKLLTLGGVVSVFILFGVALLYAQYQTLNMVDLASHITLSSMDVVAIAFFITGFGLKAGFVPLHFWAADAYPAAPTPTGMLLAGTFKQAGVYLIARVLYHVFQVMDVTSPLIATIGVLTAFIGVMMALVQHDFKRLLSYHAVSQLGYIIAGVGLAAPLGVAGGLFHLMNHAMYKGLLFLCAGAVFYRIGTWDLDEMGGLSKKMPFTTLAFLVGALAISGIPPFNGFVSKWMLYVGTYEAGYYFFTVVLILVSVGTLSSFLKALDSAFFGQLKEEFKNVTDVPLLMKIPMAGLSIFCIIFGVYPKLPLQIVEKAASATLGVTVDVHAYDLGINLEYAYWSPVMITLVGAFLVFFVWLTYRTGKAISPQVKVKPDAREDIYICGEEDYYVHVGGSNLYYGITAPLNRFYRFMKSEHNGLLQNYVFWVVLTLVFMIMYLWRVI